MTAKSVTIVGGGPVGLGLAIDLALRGVGSVVLERSTSLHRIPKGQNLTQRTGEHFRTWGITEAIEEITPIPREYGNAGLVTYDCLLGEYSYDWFQRSRVAPYYFALNQRLPQYCMEEVLRRRVSELPGIDFLTGCKVTELKVEDVGVQLEFETGEGSGALRSDYVVGCDGARSRVRELSGITQDMDHQGPRMVLLVFRSPELERLLERYPGKSIFNVMNPKMDGYWQFLGRVDLEGLYFYHAPVPGDAEGEDYFKKHLYEMVGAKFALEFEHIGFWDLRISHAASYRRGPVFIAGDAAHSHPPYGGYGVNTGLEDARNLSWKLAATLQGWGSETLLDSYSAERHPVFRSVSRDFIGRMIEDFRDFTSRYSPQKDKAEFETAWKVRAEADDSDVTQFLPHYAGSPIVLGKEGSVSGAKGTHSVKAEAGYHLAPQPLPGDDDLWEFIGQGFTLLELGNAREPGDRFEEAAQSLLVPFQRSHTPSAELRAAYGAEMILVRPDQFIAWAGQGDTADAHGILSRAIGASSQAEAQ